MLPHSPGNKSACIIKMVNWNDPVVLEEDYGKFPDRSINPMPSVTMSI
jgi:hypothetical protein